MTQRIQTGEHLFLYLKDSSTIMFLYSVLASQGECIPKLCTLLHLQSIGKH